MWMVEASSQRVMIDKAFSVPMCVRLARMSHHSHQLLKKMWGAVLGARAEDLGDNREEELLSLQRENSSGFEKHNEWKTTQ